MRAPVHDALAAVDQVVVVPVGEHLAHGARIVGIEREVLVVVIAGAPHALDLVHDGVAVFLAPLPAFLDERLAADLQARDALVGQLLVDLGLRGDASMVGAEDPARRATLHARVTRAGVLDGVVERMAHVQHARDVGRRDDDGVRMVGVFATAGAAVEVPRLVPCVEQRRLVRREIVVDLLAFFSHVGAPRTLETCQHILAQLPQSLPFFTSIEDG